MFVLSINRIRPVVQNGDGHPSFEKSTIIGQLHACDRNHSTTRSEKQMIHFDNLNGSPSTLPANQTNLTEVMCGYVEGEEDNKLFSDQRESQRRNEREMKKYTIFQLANYCIPNSAWYFNYRWFMFFGIFLHFKKPSNKYALNFK